MSENYGPHKVIDEGGLSTELYSVVCEYVQDADCADSSGAVQILKIWTENNGIENFVCFSTDRWAITDVDELVRIFKDFGGRAGCLKG